jgi:hypothetical protein
MAAFAILIDLARHLGRPLPAGFEATYRKQVATLFASELQAMPGTHEMLSTLQRPLLRNWEQGRREPTGPAKALLHAISNDPKNVLQALPG